ncbi:TVP38/TMEM64 family protein [Nocardia carnea]|uniref:TVP38/TMEM64 family protein n=1 Tax=Nocardia carnea TaxID=37328 RepID=UPI002456C9C7|nr:TVP38/TMEM64 family protein [Nocardia carnea]
MSRILRDRRLVLALCLAAVVCAAALLTPLPDPRQIQEWAQDAGPWFPVLFFTAHTLIIIAPVPRTVFTVASGLLFGPFLGLGVAVTASLLSAAAAFLLVRAFGRDRVTPYLNHPTVQIIDDRLRRRGWLAVGALRLIAFAPFSVVNYSCALSSIRFWPYLGATLVGILPGTAATVVLADALTGGTHPVMVGISIICIAAGCLGLLIDQRWRPVADGLSTDPGSPRTTPPAATPSNIVADR